MTASMEDAEGVERGADAEQDQHDREDLRRRSNGRTSRKPTVATVVTVW